MVTMDALPKHVHHRPMPSLANVFNAGELTAARFRRGETATFTKRILTNRTARAPRGSRGEAAGWRECGAGERHEFQHVDTLHLAADQHVAIP